MDEKEEHDKEIQLLQERVQQEIKKRFLQQMGGIPSQDDSKERSTIDSKKGSEMIMLTGADHENQSNAESN